VNSTDKLIESINDLPEVKRLKELDNYINNNKAINDKLNEMRTIQKKMVNAKEFDQMNQYIEYKKEYDGIIKELYDLPFVEEYMELLDYVNNILGNIKDRIESEIDNKINN
jgi:cell fate (sporulation/competence/biofilm development) regulator YmcA (YheA/YmcA/DUF963 family)